MVLLLQQCVHTNNSLRANTLLSMYPHYAAVMRLYLSKQIIQGLNKTNDLRVCFMFQSNKCNKNFASLGKA